MSFASLLVAVALMFPSQTEMREAPRPVVSTSDGPVMGRIEADILAFKAIPYAAPPTGPLRWKPPQPVQGWSEPRDAGRVGALCIQPPSGGDPGVGPMPVSEDCLTLNVWAPSEREGPLPVMVWIHGGGYNNGSGTAALYDGSNLARRDVVVVTINYRLGRLGFFDHPALATERAAGEPGGNYGVMDQIAALRWVRDNIAAFGGDPSQVTIFGESAGGVAVTQLMVAPSARGLFHRAVVQSGLGRQTSARLDRNTTERPSARSLGRDFAEAAGLGREASAEALRSLDAQAFLTPAPAFYTALILRDDQIVPQDVEDAFAAGEQAAVPLILGTNSAEFWWIKPGDQSAYGRADDAMTDAEREATITAYGGQEAYDAGIVSDLIFNEPVRHLARLHARAGHPTWFYRFDVVPVSNPEPSGGATHASERAYVFDNLETVGRPMGARDRRAATAMADYWTRFATTGDPNGGNQPEWPRAGEGDPLLEFTNDGPVAKSMPFGERLDLIERFYEKSD